MKDDFSLDLCEPKRFYNKAKLLALSSDHKDDLRFGLESLTDLMKKKPEEPIEIVKYLKEMVSEPPSFSDVCGEVEVEPRLVRKWLSSHTEQLGIIVPTVLFIVEIVLTVLHIIPFPF